jgi:hypothetical protein
LTPRIKILAAQNGQSLKPVKICGVTSYDMTRQAVQVWSSRFQTIAAAYFPFCYYLDRLCKQAYTRTVGRWVNEG